MNFLELNNEVLECARYGEPDELKEYLKAGANVNFADESGNTALHKASANGHVHCLQILREFGSKFTVNAQGNSPAHWAAENGKAEALKLLLECFEVDVLQKNGLGRSILTEAFQSKCTDCIELCLSHSSATEERLINPCAPINANKPSSDDANMCVVEEDNNNIETDIANAVTHRMVFQTNIFIQIRELPITRADNPFASETAPENDTTGKLRTTSFKTLLYVTSHIVIASINFLFDT